MPNAIEDLHRTSEVKESGSVRFGYFPGHPGIVSVSRDPFGRRNFQRKL